MLDFDVLERDLAKWLSFYLEHGGPLDRLTVSSDASESSPETLFQQLQDCVVGQGFELKQVLPLFTSNTARILQLRSKGSLEPGKDGDLLVLDPNTLDLVEVIAGGKRMFSRGELQVSEAFLEDSERRIELHGQKN
jgi:beta-aspartyl-dipeptidase (metallo-type)